MNGEEKYLKLIECPRDAMQGISEFIPTSNKISYLNQLLRCNFDTLDFGSFVSPKAIPQLRDTREVLEHLDLNESITKLLAIVGNLRGAKEAAALEKISYLGFPYSISAEFLKRNINSTPEASLKLIDGMNELCAKSNKQLVVYISMAFGNPYEEPWDVDIVLDAVKVLHQQFDIKTISLSDTIGTSTPDTISYLFSNVVEEFSDIEFGAHLHTHPETWHEKVLSAWQNGCRRLDGAVKGFGGCPMAKDELVGNMPTEHLIHFADDNEIQHGIDRNEFEKAMHLALETFP